MPSSVSTRRMRAADVTEHRRFNRRFWRANVTIRRHRPREPRAFLRCCAADAEAGLDVTPRDQFEILLLTARLVAAVLHDQESARKARADRLARDLEAVGAGR